MKQIDSQYLLRDPRLRFFHEFVAELLRQLPHLSQTFSAEESETDAFEIVAQEFVVHINSARRNLADSYGEDVFLIAIGLVDELLLNLDWPGREWWKHNLLEHRIYRTKTLGDKFYRIADRVLESHREQDLPLVLVLLDAMALGFCGRYGNDGLGKMSWARYRNNLAERVNEGFDETYIDYNSHYVSQTSPTDIMQLKGIPSLRKWTTIYALALVSMLAFSHWLWWSTVLPVHEFINEATALSSVDAEGQGE